MLILNLFEFKIERSIMFLSTTKLDDNSEFGGFLHHHYNFKIFIKTKF